MKKVLIVGATSAIAQEVARIYAQRGDYVFLVGRDGAKVDAVAEDLKVRGCPNVGAYIMDANDFSAHAPMLDAAEAALNGLNTVLIAHGTLSDQEACQQSVDLTMAEIRTNALSAIALLTEIANRFERQGKGTIAVISSVAGDRGRQSNYVYGSAKAMVTAFLSGLNQRLYKSGVDVVTIKPGFVDTPMTQGLDLPQLLVASPQAVAKRIFNAMERGAVSVYVPGFWALIMLAIIHIPNVLFRKLKL
jgi:short-subunit dehydrogenase